MQTYLSCNGTILDLTRPAVMGILNLMPHSFSPIGRVHDLKEAINYAQQMVRAGVDIIDIGAEPTHPQNEINTSEEQELAALLPVIKAITSETNIPISVDTSRPRVMEAVVAAGAHMINDVRGLRVPGALAAAAALPVPICLMHMRYLRLPDQTEISSNTAEAENDLLTEIDHFFEQQFEQCEAAGIKRERLILDPGVGSGVFGKSLIENLQLIHDLAYFKKFNVPILIGASRKQFLGELLNVPVEKRFAGSLAAALKAMQNGANILRVHDVAATVQAMKVMYAIDTFSRDKDRAK